MGTSSMDAAQLKALYERQLEADLEPPDPGHVPRFVTRERLRVSRAMAGGESWRRITQGPAGCGRICTLATPTRPACSVGHSRMSRKWTMSSSRAGSWPSIGTTP